MLSLSAHQKLIDQVELAHLCAQLPEHSCERGFPAHQSKRIVTPWKRHDTKHSTDPGQGRDRTALELRLVLERVVGLDALQEVLLAPRRVHVLHPHVDALRDDAPVVLRGRENMASAT